MSDLHAGYTRASGGKRAGEAYHGVLRTATGVIRWTCAHEHIITVQALHCAETEQDRRREVAREVTVLRHCAECDVYYGEGAHGPPRQDLLDQDCCQRCARPLEEGRYVRVELLAGPHHRPGAAGVPGRGALPGHVRHRVRAGRDELPAGTGAWSSSG